MRLAVRLSATLHTVRQVIEAMVEAFVESASRPQPVFVPVSTRSSGHRR